jgi:DNA-binding transcriptional MerR regulator
VSGQRRYSREAIHIIAVLRLAQACGFHLDEMRQLLHGFRPGVSASRRWRELAQKKRVELNNQIEQLRAMRRVVDRVLKCDCAEISACGRIAVSLANREIPNRE